jgi:hypothetical protein
LIPFVSGVIKCLETFANRRLFPQAAVSDKVGVKTIIDTTMPFVYVCVAFATPAVIGFYFIIDSLLKMSLDTILVRKRYLVKKEIASANMNSIKPIRALEYNIPQKSDQEVESLYCIMCGNKLKTRPMFCPFCGVNIDESYLG